jgi:hypothetical protein
VIRREITGGAVVIRGGIEAGAAGSLAGSREALARLLVVYADAAPRSRRSPWRALRHRPTITERVRIQEAMMMSARTIGAPEDGLVG